MLLKKAWNCWDFSCTRWRVAIFFASLIFIKSQRRLFCIHSCLASVCSVEKLSTRNFPLKSSSQMACPVLTQGNKFLSLQYLYESSIFMNRWWFLLTVCVYTYVLCVILRFRHLMDSIYGQHTSWETYPLVGCLAKTLKHHYHMHQNSTATIHKTPLPCTTHVELVHNMIGPPYAYVECLHSLAVQKYIPGQVILGQDQHYLLKGTKSATTT